MKNRLFEYIYINAQKLREAKPNAMAARILQSYDIVGNDPHKIAELGRKFNTLPDMFFSDDDREIDQNTFAIQLYKELLNKGIDNKRALDFVYYFFKYVTNKFILPKKYTTIQYFGTTVEGTDYRKDIPIPRSKGLYIYLVDIIDASGALFNDEFDKKLSVAIKSGEAIDNNKEKKFVSMIKNLK